VKNAGSQWSRKIGAPADHIFVLDVANVIQIAIFAIVAEKTK